MPEFVNGIPYPAPPPRPEPAHQKKITREKWGEIAIVVSLIIAGASFLAWRTYSQAPVTDAAKSIAESAAALKESDAIAVGEKEILGRTFWSFHKPLAGFTANIDLVGEREDSELEMAIIWLTPIPGKPAPSENDLQVAVNGAGEIAQSLLQSAGLAFEKAAKTMEPINAIRPHDKGVGATTDGWKLTYITYHRYDDMAAPQPMLCIVLHRLSAAERDDLGALNRALYQALENGEDVKTYLLATPQAPPGA